MEKHLEVMKHITELYSGDTTDEKIYEWATKNSETATAWQEALKKYDLRDCLMAVDEFWNYKSDKSRPRIAQLLAILNSKKEVQEDKYADIIVTNDGEMSKSQELWNIDPALAYYYRDLECNGKAHGLMYYRQALRDIIAEYVDTLPNGKDWNYGKKIKMVRNNGWNSDITQRVEELSPKTKEENAKINDLFKAWSLR